jgi:SHS2 domain-containing protein
MAKAKKEAEYKVLVLDHEAMSNAVNAAALARAMADYTKTQVTTGELAGVALLCATMCGGATEVDQNWKKIRSAQSNYAEIYLSTIYAKAGEGISSLKSYVGQLEKLRDDCMDKVQAKFDEARKANQAFIENAEIGFQAARAVRIAAWGTVALLSGIGGVAGVAGTTAFGVKIAGFGFLEGTLVTIGLKGTYNFSTGWLKETTVEAIAINTKDAATKDAKSAAKQKTYEETTSKALQGLLNKFANSIGLEKKSLEKLKIAQKKFEALAKIVNKTKGQKYAYQQAEKTVAKHTATAAKNAPKAVVAKTAGRLANFASNAFPVIWLCDDLHSIYQDGAEDLKMLD